MIKNKVKPAPGHLLLKVCDALVDFDAVTNDLFYGGPVAKDTLHYLHRYGDIIEDSLHIADDVYWGGNFEQIGELLRDGTLDSKTNISVEQIPFIGEITTL